MPAADGPAPGLPFWIHQIVEYRSASSLIFQAVQTAGRCSRCSSAWPSWCWRPPPTARSPRFHVVSRPVHRVLDIGVIVVIVLVIVFERDAMGGAGLLFIGLAAVALVGLVLRTNYRPKARGHPVLVRRRRGVGRSGAGRLGERVQERGLRAGRGSRRRFGREGLPQPQGAAVGLAAASSDRPHRLRRPPPPAGSGS